jgi:hypothetical protein
MNASEIAGEGIRVQEATSAIDSERAELCPLCGFETIPTGKCRTCPNCGHNNSCV